ncbi:MAG TPA: hypothetical protein VHB21_12970, partial [Minicystis sp.]|nr:hypothetical protein [Minicystis sp.]
MRVSPALAAVGSLLLSAATARADTFAPEEHVYEVPSPRAIGGCDLAVRADGDVLAAFSASEADDGNHFDPFVADLHAGAWHV